MDMSRKTPFHVSWLLQRSQDTITPVGWNDSLVHDCHAAKFPTASEFGPAPGHRRNGAVQMNQSLPATRLTPEGTLVLPNRLIVKKCTRGPCAIPSESTANATNPFRIADFRFRDRSRRPIEDPVLDAGRRSKRRGGVEAPIPDASGADLRCRGEDPARRRCVVSIRCRKFFQPIE
jgi:hypothetical protein